MSGMLRLYRITAIPKHADKTASPFTLDVILDESEMLADDDRPIFGMQGEVEGLSPDRIPLVIDRRGAIDYGSAYDDKKLKDHRRYQSNIRTVKLSVGNEFTIIAPDGTVQTFAITDRALLLGE
jgi:hypothetical protein